MQANIGQSLEPSMSIAKKVKKLTLIRKKEFYMISGCAVLVVLIALSAYALTKLHRLQDICLTEECVQSASYMMKSMDRTAKPCEDFYQFACGNWIKTHAVPSHLAFYDVMVSIREKVSSDLTRILQKKIDEHDDVPESYRKAKRLFDTCMDTATLDKNGMEPIYDVLNKTGLTRYPPVNETSQKFDWLYTIVRAKRLLGLDLFVSSYVSTDVRNTTVNKLVVSQVAPGFKQLYLLDPKKFSNEINIYKTFISNMTIQYGVKFQNTTEFANDVVNFMIKIAQVMTGNKIRRSPAHLFFDVTLHDLAEGPKGAVSWKIFDWRRYLNMLFNDTSVVLNPKIDMAIITDLEYVKKLSVLLNKTDDVTIEKYLWWRIFLSTAGNTKNEFRKLEFNLLQDFFDTTKPQSRATHCTLSVKNNFGMALGYMYLQSNLKKEIQTAAVAMMENIKLAFEEDVVQHAWMDEATLQHTLEKIRAMKLFVDIPNEIMNRTKLDLLYKNATVVGEDLTKTYLNLTYANVKLNLESLRKRPNKDLWAFSPIVVNAHYSVGRNAAIVPRGILQPPFFGNGLKTIDYGSIGAIMGHEIIHGFDDQGRKYDKQGNLNQWWTNSTLQEYNKKVKCLIDQYNQYYLPELGAKLRVDGFKTQGENIADNGGIRIAFKAYKRERFYSSSNNRLPGLLEFTPEQLFFLGYAQVWCANGTSKYMKDWMFNEVHSPNRVRVIGTLANYEEFAKAWNCPAGTSMNPIQKCRVW
ncbi:neprilysin-4 [Aethina tumida]|uniref:neprilysin-4 n=1 Tax=Aethina tumida TaxID=116153 RepID=UPI00096AF995|nr:neprilysin-4 [Aethina tumida]